VREAAAPCVGQSHFSGSRQIFQAAGSDQKFKKKILQYLLNEKWNLFHPTK